jgi:hypothetical protein
VKWFHGCQPLPIIYWYAALFILVCCCESSYPRTSEEGSLGLVLYYNHVLYHALYSIRKKKSRVSLGG